MKTLIKIKPDAIGVYDYNPNKYYEVENYIFDTSSSSYITSYEIINDIGVLQIVSRSKVDHIFDGSDSDYDDTPTEAKDTIQVRYFDDFLPKLQVTEKGDCIDLRVSKCFECDEDLSGKIQVSKYDIDFPIKYCAGDVLFFKLGVGMKLPKGYKANVYPRSSTFKNYGFILTNSVGIIDNAYCHEGDEWCAMVYCTRSGVIEYGDRILQFEPVPVYTHNFMYNVVDSLDEGARGGYGSTGVK